jgi:hypothetical protein
MRNNSVAEVASAATGEWGAREHDQRGWWAMVAGLYVDVVHGGRVGWD